MTGRDDFENRLGQGLKRWAQAGEPSIDLEALVRERMGEAGTGQEPVKPRSRRWMRWLGGAAAAAAVLLAMGVTFPSWAGAAASWPLVGPYFTKIILEDAGMKWAYDMGLIEGNVAEVTQNGVTVRILGVVADARRTTVLYQVQGAPPPEPQDGRPIRADSLIAPPSTDPREPVSGSISKVNGQGAASSFSGPEYTPLGYIGTMSTLPLETAQAKLELSFRVGGEQITLTVPASRVESDRFSREVAVNQSLELDGIRITVEAVIYTPAETVVRYRVESEPFDGPLQWDPEVDYNYLEASGRRYRESSSNSMAVNYTWYKAFPPVNGPATLVLQPQVKGDPIDAVWPLEEGAVAEVLGVPVTLTSYELQPDGIGFTWESPASHEFRGVGRLAVIDSEGNAYPLGEQTWASMSNYTHEGIRYQDYATELPEGVKPVAVRATRAAVVVDGPWVFELPR